MTISSIFKFLTLNFEIKSISSQFEKFVSIGKSLFKPCPNDLRGQVISHVHSFYRNLFTDTKIIRKHIFLEEFPPTEKLN